MQIMFPFQLYIVHSDKNVEINHVTIAYDLEVQTLVTQNTDILHSWRCKKKYDTHYININIWDE